MNNREKVIKGLECLARKQEPSANPCKGCGYIDKANFAFCVLDVASDALELLKEQELGHWIFLTDCSNSGVYCSECNTKVFDSYPFKKKLSYFCPHCGTRMEGEIERR